MRKNVRAGRCRPGNVRSPAYAPAVDTVFGPGGAIERELPGYEPRPEQAALAGSVERALTRGEHLLAEAGTGVGKSLAYLVPALASGQRVVVATATKALQEQLLDKDVPVAAAVVGRPVDVVVLKGPAELPLPPAAPGLPAVPALGRAATAARGRRCRTGSTRPRPATAPSSRSSRRTRSGRSSPSAPTAARVAAARSTARASPRRRACPRGRGGPRDRRTTRCTSRTSPPGGGVLPEHDAVVFDEAHRLEESAASWLGGRVSRGAAAAARQRRRACLP